jgi:hypothetical protein
MIRLTGMSRNFYLYYLVWVGIGAAAAFGQQGLQDPVFNRIPFEQWLKEKGDTHMRWSADVTPSRLSVYQRLSVVLSVRVDGAEFLKRNGPGQMVVFIEIRDRDDRVFRTHRALHFEEVKNPGDLATINFEQYAFIVPGDYQVAAAIYDTGSKEHALKRIKLHVPEVAHDPLPNSWRDLPEVEYATISDPPDGWYLPEVSSRLSLPVPNQKPVRVEVVVNESPTELATGRTGRTMKRNMGNLIPALKVLSQMDIKNGSINVTLLDLERRKASFHQEEAAKIDWARLRAALLDNDPNQIDVHALENHEQNAQFFVSEVRKRLESTESNGDVPLGISAEPARALIVLSGPMAFPKGQDLRPIEAAPEPGSRVFYICYYPPRPGVFTGTPSQQSGLGRNMNRGLPRTVPEPGLGPGRGPSTEDSLGRTLKPLGPRTFDVMTPMEFRMALAAIMNEISRVK